MAPRLVFALVTALAAAPVAQAQQPPPIVLLTKETRQRAVQQSYCVTQPSGDGWVTGCGDSLYIAPRRYTPVRAGQVVRIRIRGATSARGRVDIHVRSTGRRIGAFRLSGPETHWRVSLRRVRDYVLVVSVGEFVTADGRTGDTSGNLGLRVLPAR